MYDYAHYNEVLLGNKSYIFYEKNNGYNHPKIIEKFNKRFIVNAVNNFNEVDNYLIKYKITHIYISGAGEKNERISKVAKNCIHCVFGSHEPHGDVYSTISLWVSGNDGKYPVVPYMINLPKNKNNMRKKLKIPNNAIVFGGYGGSGSFNIEVVHDVVYNIARANPNIYFLFVNLIN